jgi:hypothetical protein
MKEKPSKFADMLRTRKDDETPETEPTAKRGRPGGQGKRKNPNYAQVTAYIPKKLHDETKVNLIRLNNREFSQLVEELLWDWNLKQKN